MTKEMCNETAKQIEGLRKENRYLMAVIVFVCLGVKISEIIPF